MHWVARFFPASTSPTDPAGVSAETDGVSAATVAVSADADGVSAGAVGVTADAVEVSGATDGVSAGAVGVTADAVEVTAGAVADAAVADAATGVIIGNAAIAVGVEVDSSWATIAQIPAVPITMRTSSAMSLFVIFDFPFGHSIVHDPSNSLQVKTVPLALPKKVAAASFVANATTPVPIGVYRLGSTT